MDERILAQNIFTRVSDWNENGIKGDNITIWNLESDTDHSEGTRKRILDAAPNAIVINRPLNLRIKNDIVTESTVYDPQTNAYISAEDFVKQNNIDILTCSRSGYKRTKARIDWFEKLMRDHNLVCFNSAGNDGSEGPNRTTGGGIPEEVAMYIGACIMYKLNPKDIRMAHYSSHGDAFEHVDFSSFTGSLNGTSFSTPYLAGTAALLRQRYGKLTHDEIYNYFKMVSKPIDTEVQPNVLVEFQGGRYLYDKWSGYGVPRLPKIDKKYVSMKIDSNFYKINGKSVLMDTAPFIKNSRTFVPISFLSISLGANVYWDHKLKKVTIRKDDTTIVLYIGKKTYTVNGAEYEMDTAPFIQDSRTFVPVSFVALHLNCRVSWCEKERIVQILEMDILED